MKLIYFIYSKNIKNLQNHIDKVSGILYIEIDHEGERNAMMNETDVEIQSLSIQSSDGCDI